MAVVAPAEADLTVLDGEEAVVGDGDAVGVLAEVVEDLVGAGEGGLGGGAGGSGRRRRGG